MAAVAFIIPLLPGPTPRLRLPEVMLAIAAGIAIGPSGLGWVEADGPIRVLSLLGLAFVLLAGFAALAEVLGLEVILGAFIAGTILRLVDQDATITHPQFRVKPETIGFGVFIPFFFITSGLRFNLDALLASPSTLARVPVLLIVLLAVRGLPALRYRPLIGGRQALAGVR